MKLLKEPLLHFLLIGAAFFVLFALVNPESVTSEKRIVVENGRINNMVAVFARTWNREPSREELQGLIDNFILEEIYYRQALAMGIDENDPVIRRRLRQKMEFFTSEASSRVTPEDKELEQYLQTHADKYQTDNSYSFEQRYLSPDRPADQLEKLLQQTAQQIAKGEMAFGDQTLLPSNFSAASGFEVNRTLGDGFSEKLDSLPVGEWSGPIQSGLGFHFVKLRERQIGQLPPLAQVRDKVLRDWSYDKSLALKQDLDKKLKEEYQVIIKWPKKA